MDSGVAALLGALVGGTASLIGTYLLQHHEIKTRWDADRRSGYLEFLEVAGLLQERLESFADSITQWHEGDIDSEEILTTYEEHIAERRSLADRLGVVQTQFMLYAPSNVLTAAGGVVAALRLLLDLQNDMVEAERRDEGLAKLATARTEIEKAIDSFVRACRRELRIPIPK